MSPWSRPSTLVLRIIITPIYIYIVIRVLPQRAVISHFSSTATCSLTCFSMHTEVVQDQVEKKRMWPYIVVLLLVPPGYLWPSWGILYERDRPIKITVITSSILPFYLHLRRTRIASRASVQYLSYFLFCCLSGFSLLLYFLHFTHCRIRFSSVHPVTSIWIE